MYFFRGSDYFITYGEWLLARIIFEKFNEGVWFDVIHCHPAMGAIFTVSATVPVVFGAASEVDWGAEMALQGSPNFGDPDFERILSGLYWARASRIQRFVIGNYLIKESDFPLPCLIAQGGPDAHRYSSYQYIYILYIYCVLIISIFFMPFRRETLLQSVPLLRRAPDEDRKNLDVHDRRELATLMKSTCWMRKRLPSWKSLEVIV